jgi:SPP1 family predicted phage head-tail adaptor
MSGALRHRLSLERSGKGGWVSIAQVWAAISPVSGAEAMTADRLAPRVLHEIRLRYRPGVTADMRFRLGARVFHILSVINQGERGRYLVCRAEERTP